MNTIIKTCLLLLISHSTFAYGPLGHQVVAALAWDQLTPFAKQNVGRILGQGEESFIKSSTWADEIKSDSRFNYLKPMHYVNLPKTAHSYVEKRDCKKKNCIVSAIKKFTTIAKTGSPKEQTLALRMLVHLFADIHQPLHAGLREDRGGNWYEIEYKKKTISLHKFWDNHAVKRQGKSLEELKEKLTIQTPPNQAGKPKQWAEHSHSLVMAHVYNVKEGDELSEAYLQKADEITQKQLVHAGYRLGMWLNRLW